jgi:2-isopropylmalate synthase
MVADTLDFIRGNGLRVIFDAEHFFDGYRYNADYSLEVLRTAAEHGAETLVLCDTNGGSLPELVAETVADVCSKVGVKIGIHCHNDCGVAVANTLAAVDAGASHVQGTINGFGERCGNADLIQVIAALALKKNSAYELLRPDSPTHLTDLSRFVYEMLNVQIPSNLPYVGRSAFAHKGGMHVSGIARNKTAYEHIVPESVGNERRILVSELSGRSNIVALTQKFSQPIEPALTQKILDEVVARENDGYQYEVADGSFELLVKRCTNTFKPHFERINYHLIVQSDEHGVWETSAAIKIKIGDIIRHDVAEGDGPVNALDAALRKALLPIYPQLSDMKLVDYKVRVINSEAATAAGVRVVIESSDSKSQWGTVGVSTNIVEASWLALVDSIEFKLNRT